MAQGWCYDATCWIPGYSIVIFKGIRADLDATDNEGGVANAIGVRYYKGLELHRRLSMQRLAIADGSEGVFYLYNPVTGAFLLTLDGSGDMRSTAL